RHTSTHGQKMVAHFFFSSRRRHTRFSRDWSSDVCSSDLVETDIASEFRYRAPVMAPGGLALFISQSGETADTLAALKWAKSQGQHTAAVVNQVESTMAREADVVLPTRAGPEIGVASTKAFTTQLAVLACFAIAMARARGAIGKEEEAALSTALTEIPARAAQVLEHDGAIQKIAHRL